MKEFFFDTANIDFIKSTMDKYGSKIDRKWVKGITTNPNAFSKINKFHLEEWFLHVGEMSNLISDIRGDNQGEIHIQAPYSHADPDIILKYSEMIPT